MRSIFHLPLAGLVIAALLALGGCPTATDGSSPAPKSSEARLESLAPSAGALEPEFDPDTTAYTVMVGHAVDSITFTATPAHEGAGVGNNGVPLDIAVGFDNFISLRVTAEDGTTAKDYTVNVIRDDGLPKIVRAGPYTNGFITPSPESGPLGTAVSLSVSAPEGWHINPLSLKYKITGKDREYPIALNTNSFTLPAGNVTVLAEFISMEEFTRLFIPVPGAEVRVSPVDGDSAEYPFTETKLPVTVGDFEIGAAEITVGLWNEVRAWAVHDDRGENKYTIVAGNSMVSGNPSDLLPVAVHWKGFVVWCNAYSEYAKAELGSAYADFEPLYVFNGTVLRNAVYTAEGLTSDWVELLAPDPAKKGFRLPAEAEWEFAARGGVPSADETAPWNWLYAGQRDGYDAVAVMEAKAPPGTKLPNTLGIYDMSGNVREATFDLSADGNRVYRGWGYGMSSAPKISARTVSSSGGVGAGFRIVCQR